MSNELTLFDVDEPELKKLSNTHGTQASKDAARKVAPHLKGIKKQIVDLLEQTPQGLTIFEIAEILKIQPIHRQGMIFWLRFWCCLVYRTRGQNND